MSLRIDASEYFADSLVIGNTGLGVLAENIPSDGDSGASFLFNDLSFPADTGKEIRAQITAWPAFMSLFVYEDGSFEVSGADGADFFEALLFVDGVQSTTDIGHGSGIQRVYLAIGAVNATASGSLPSISFSAPIATASGTAVVHGVASGGVVAVTLTPPEGSAIGTVAGDGSASGTIRVISLVAPSGSASGTSSVGVTLSPADIAAIANAVYVKFVAEGYENDVADALLSRTWP